MKTLINILLVIGLLTLMSGCVPVMDVNEILDNGRSSSSGYMWIGQKNLYTVDGHAYFGYWRKSRASGEYQMIARFLKFNGVDIVYGVMFEYQKGGFRESYNALTDNAIPLHMVIPESRVASIR